VDGRGLRIERDGAVAELVLDRPEALHAVSTALAAQIAGATGELAADDRVRAVVLRSSTARAFCAGADLRERQAATTTEVLARRATVRAAYAGVRRMPVPVVAAVAGYALGGGFEMALSCDLVVADETAMFGLPEVTLGMVPAGGGTQLLAHRVGYGRAADLVLTGRRIDAAEAARLGIVDRLVPPGQAHATARELATTIAASPPAAVRAAKRAMRTGLGQRLEAALEAEDEAWRQALLADEWRGRLERYAGR
jgi:enoyl-CoA hydratase/carnithine racemase